MTSFKISLLSSWRPHLWWPTFMFRGKGKAYTNLRRKLRWRWAALSTVGKPCRARGTPVMPWGVCIWPSCTSWQPEYQQLSFVFLEKIRTTETRSEGLKKKKIKRILNSHVTLASGQGSSSLSSTTKLPNQVYQGSHHHSRESRGVTRFLWIGRR